MYVMLCLRCIGLRLGVTSVGIQCMEYKTFEAETVYENLETWLILNAGIFKHIYFHFFICKYCEPE